MSVTLRPRFLPDPDAPKEWGTQGAWLARMVRTGFRVPPTSAFGKTQVQEWKSSQTGDLLLAPMPEHFPLSTETLLQVLMGEERNWPLILRAGNPESQTPSVLVEKPTPEGLWDAFKKITSDPVGATSVLVQPVLHGEIVGRSYSRNPKDPTELNGLTEWTLPTTRDQKKSRQSDWVPAELKPFWKDLWVHVELAEKIVKGPALLNWLWDGEQLWFLKVSPIQPPQTSEAKRTIRHLLVDLDGTLLGAHNTPLRFDFTHKTLREFRKHTGWLRAVQAMHAIQTVIKIPATETTDEHTNGRRVIQAFSKSLKVPVIQGEEILKNTIAQVFPSLKRYFFPIPGAKDFLEWAKERYPMTLATNPVWDVEYVKLRLEWAGIESNIFWAMTHAGIMHACKPTSDYYRHVMRLSPGLDPSQYLLIGDDVKNDLPATRVGIPVFILSEDSTAIRIPTPRGSAPAWKGNYLSLRKFLSEETA